MSATTKRVLSFELVTDHDCGNYQIGEIDIHTCGDLPDLIAKYGEQHFYEGVTKAAWRIMEAIREKNMRGQSQACEAK